LEISTDVDQRLEIVQPYRTGKRLPEPSHNS
jgi:hypothetical protein